MFKIEAFVEDKRLAEALRALAGLIRGQPSVVPVVNAVHHHGKVKAKSNGALLDMFSQHLTESKLDNFNATKAKEFLKASGRSPSSSNYLLRQAVQAKLIKRSGKGSASIYHVLPKKG
jgi:hypothetical protein